MVGVEIGVFWDYVGGNVVVLFGEVRVGFFVVRVGVKFGVGIRNGVLELDFGLVFVLCFVM